MGEARLCEAWGCPRNAATDNILCEQCWYELPSGLREYVTRQGGNCVHSLKYTTIFEFLANSAAFFYLAAANQQLTDSDIPMLAAVFLEIARKSEGKER